MEKIDYTPLEDEDGNKETDEDIIAAYNAAFVDAIKE